MAPRRSARIKALAASKPNQARFLPSLVGVEQQQKCVKPKAGKPKTTITTTTTTTTGGKKGKGGGVTKTKKKPTSTTKSKSKGKKTTATKKTNPNPTTSRTSTSPAKTSPVKDLATTLQSRTTEAIANIARKVSSSAEAIASPTSKPSNTGSPSRKQSGPLAKAAEVISPNKNNRARTPGRAASSPSPGKRAEGAGAGVVGKGRAKSEGRA